MKVTGNLVKKGIRLVQQFDPYKARPYQLQKKVLINLLKRAEITSFGRHYQFQNLLLLEDPVKAFQERVPVFDYDKIFTEWWHRSLEGEANISWHGHVKYFALSSGTSGAASKYIPVTYDMRRTMRQAALRMLSCLPKYRVSSGLYLKDWLMVGGSADLKDLGHCYIGDLSGINASKPPIWLRRIYKPGTQIAKISDWDERATVIAKNAPKWDVGVITGIPSWVQLTLERIVEYHKLNHIHELWPNLSIYVSGGTAFEPYRKSLEQLLARPLIYQDSYLASEGFIAYQARPGTHAMRMILHNGIFYEFIPFNEHNFDAEGKLKENPITLTIDEIEEGKDYALLMSTCAGAWRYLIGDTIRFTDKARSEIVITGRTKHFLSICGEHLSVDNMNQAIKLTEDELNISIREYTVSGVKAGSHFAHKWYLGCDNAVDKLYLGQLLDKHLKRVNDDYRAERAAMLQALQLEIIPNKLFYDWQRYHGKMNGQSKFPRVMNKEQFAEWEKFVSEKKMI